MITILLVFPNNYFLLICAFKIMYIVHLIFVIYVINMKSPHFPQMLAYLHNTLLLKTISTNFHKTANKTTMPINSPKPQYTNSMFEVPCLHSQIPQLTSMWTMTASPAIAPTSAQVLCRIFAIEWYPVYG